MPSYGSLFTGVGGFDLGFDAAGYECRFQAEWDKHCQQVLQRHWPDVPKWWDVSEVNGGDLPPVEVLIFGSPCQDLSVAGKRAGLTGDRSVLFYEGIRIIKEMRDATDGAFPRVVVWENVAGALTSNGGADFGVVLDEMAKSGALVIEWAVLDAQHFGVPQRRRRVFVIAVYDSGAAGDCPDPILPVGDSVRRDTQKGAAKGQATPEALAVGFGKSSFGGWEEVDIAIPLSARDTKGPLTTVVEQQPFVKSRRAQSVDDHETWIQSEVAPTLNQFDGGDTRATTAIVVPLPPLSFDTQFGSNAGVYEDMSPTLKASQQQPSVNLDDAAMSVRRLSPVECERLMGWPDDHTRWRADGKEQSDSHRFRQCGNGVATPVAKWIAGHLTRVLK